MIKRSLITGGRRPKANLPRDGLTALCISQASADALAPLAFAQIKVAVRPNQDAMLTLADAPNAADVLRRSAFYLVALAWIIHTFGLIFRMVLEGRPPVTNLYSSAIFIGWAAVILGLALEITYKVGIGCLVATIAGFDIDNSTQLGD